MCRAVSAFNSVSSITTSKMSDDELTTRSKLRSNTVRGASQQTTKEMSVAELANLMTTQLSSLRQNTKEDINKLGEKLTVQMENMKVDLSADIEKLREECNRSMGDLTAKVDKNKADFSHALEVVTRTDDLIVNGVPFTCGEDLTRYFHAWCNALGYKENEYPLVVIRRLSSKKLENGAVAVILIQFAFTVHRNEFYSRYMRTRKLSLSMIGFSVDKRVFVNENLGPTARDIRSKALKLRKEGKLRSVFTKNGTVYIKRSLDDHDVAVSSIDDLELLFHQ